MTVLPSTACIPASGCPTRPARPSAGWPARSTATWPPPSCPPPPAAARRTWPWRRPRRARSSSSADAVIASCHRDLGGACAASVKKKTNSARPLACPWVSNVHAVQLEVCLLLLLLLLLPLLFLLLLLLLLQILLPLSGVRQSVCLSVKTGRCCEAFKGPFFILKEKTQVCFVALGNSTMSSTPPHTPPAAV